jgi:ABC-type uncharacterized transport system substrate-binding protein
MTITPVQDPPGFYQNPALWLAGTMMHDSLSEVRMPGGTGPICRCVTLGLLLFTTMMVLPTKSSAHPHMFIDAMVKFMVTDTSLAGFYVYWDFDEMYSASLRDEFDTNGNKRFDPDEVEKIFSNAFSFAANSNYFTVFAWGTSFLKIRKTEKFIATIRPSSTVRYSFYVPCDIPLDDIDGEEVSMLFDDPTMYIAFTLKKDLVQASNTDKVATSIRFAKADYLDRIVLTVRREDS